MSCTAPVTRNAFLQLLFKRPTPAPFLKLQQKLYVLSHFKKSAKSIAPATQKDGRKSKSRRSNVVRFCNFEFEICFAPQLRSFFEQLSYQKVPDLNCFKILTLTSIYVSRRSRVHLSNSTSKSAPRLLLAWGCALRQRRVHFLRRSTSKCAPELRCF